MGAEATPSEAAKPVPRKWRVHWHIISTHFPISAFLGAFMFMALHVLTLNPCYSLAAYVSLLAGTLVTVPTVLSGWLEWRHYYGAHKSPAFLGKIWVGVAMPVVSPVLVLYQALHPFTALDASHNLAHALYLAGVTLLMVGAVAEGYWGGRLHHR